MKKLTIDDAFNFAAQALSTMPNEQIIVDSQQYCVCGHVLNRSLDVRPLRDELSRRQNYWVHHKSYHWVVLGVGDFETCHFLRKSLL